MSSKDIVAAETGSAIEQYMAEFGESPDAPVGLEGLDSSDVALAKINIDHSEAKFVDSLTGESYEQIDGVLLGVMKQRVMWDPDPDAKDLLCRSRDSVIGNPQNNFPTADFKAKNGQFLPNGDVACAKCPFAEWGSHPKNDTPWCTQQYVMPVVVGEGPDVTGLVTFQRSGLSAAKGFVSGFVRDRLPLFSHRVKIELQAGKKGSVKFATPKFTRGEPIDNVDNLRKWGEDWKTIRDISQGTGHAPAPAASDTRTIEGSVAAPVIEGDSETSPF